VIAALRGKFKRPSCRIIHSRIDASIRAGRALLNQVPGILVAAMGAGRKRLAGGHGPAAVAPAIRFPKQNDGCNQLKPLIDGGGRCLMGRLRLTIMQE